MLSCSGSVTLTGGQDVKIQLLTNQVTSACSHTAVHRNSPAHALLAMPAGKFVTNGGISLSQKIHITISVMSKLNKSQRDTLLMYTLFGSLHVHIVWIITCTRDHASSDNEGKLVQQADNLVRSSTTGPKTKWTNCF